MTVDIESIEIGERRREDYGDLAGLAASLRQYGLIHPVVIDSDRRLIAGGRRLEAARILAWKQIEARDFGELTEDERREIELEENLRRKDLTPFEQARELVRKAPIVAEAISSKCEEKDPRGRKSEYAAPKRDVAEALGASEGALIQAEQHVTTAEAYPFMQSPEWKQYHVLEAREHLQKLPEDDRAALAPMLAEPFTPPQMALAMLKNVAAMPEERREKVLELYQSEDERERSLAKTMACELPPAPDHRSVILVEVVREIKECCRLYPDDEFNAELRLMLKEVVALKRRIDAAHDARKANAN